MKSDKDLETAALGPLFLFWFDMVDQSSNMYLLPT